MGIILKAPACTDDEKICTGCWTTIKRDTKKCSGCGNQQKGKFVDGYGNELKK